MKIMLVDDEQHVLDEMGYMLSRYPDVEVLAAFLHPIQAIEYMERRLADRDSIPEAVFLDMDMPKLNGIETAVRLLALKPELEIVFLTAYSSYALDSFQVHPLDYLLKPLKESRLDSTLKQLREQIHLLQEKPPVKKNAVHIQCFGRFQLTVSGRKETIKWGTRRVKELLMYLIDRCGESITHHELLGALFEGKDDRKTANNLYVTIHKLRQLLQSIDPVGEWLILKNDLALEISPGICDYIDFMNFARQNPLINSANAGEAEAALGLSKGLYLQDVARPWAEQSSAAVDLEYQRIALGLAVVYNSSGRYRDAEKVLLDLISRNPLSDEGHTGLLDLYIRNKQKEEFILVYRQYSRMLKSELDEPPPPQYTRYYNTIRRK